MSANHQTQQAVQRVFGPPATHMHRTGYRGPLCGQVSATGTGFARTHYTADAAKVTCKKCCKALAKLPANPDGSATSSSP
jgi:hypothetical protein